jgi:hypothetical protein
VSSLYDLLDGFIYDRCCYHVRELTVLCYNAYRNVTFYTGDITFPDDLAEAITKVSISDRNRTID